MKPFSLEAAKRGEPILYVVLDTKYPAHFVGEAEDGAPVIQCGKKYFACCEDEIRMAPRKVTMYVNVYSSRLNTIRNHGNQSATFDTEEGARDNAKHNGIQVIAVAVPIEIEV